jgi:hypothetical protein
VRRIALFLLSFSVLIGTATGQDKPVNDAILDKIRQSADTAAAGGAGGKIDSKVSKLLGKQDREGKVSEALDKQVNGQQFAKVAAVILEMQDLEAAVLAKLQGNQRTGEEWAKLENLAQLITSIILSLTPEQMNDPAIILLVENVIKALREAHAEMAKNGVEESKASALLAKVGGTVLGAANEVGRQKRQDELAEQKRADGSLLKRSLEAADKTEKPKEPARISIWPAWMGATPDYSHAYSEIAPALITGHKASYEGVARGADPFGSEVQGAFFALFETLEDDTVSMEGVLLGLEFDSILTSPTNSFSLNIHHGSTDLSWGTEGYYSGGSLTGKFYGSGHENVAGTFALTGDGNPDLSGHFVGVGE